MSLRDTLAALVQAVPVGTLIPVSHIAELLATEEHAATAPQGNAVVDATVLEVAERFGRAASTIRTWCERGELPGAYRSHGREWRIPAAAINAMQRAQAKRHTSTSRRVPSPVAALGAWREHMPQPNANGHHA